MPKQQLVKIMKTLKKHSLKKINDKVNEDIHDELNFPLDKDCRGAIHDKIRRIECVPCQRARKIGPEETRQIHCEQIDKFKAALIQKTLKVVQWKNGFIEKPH